MKKQSKFRLVKGSPKKKEAFLDLANGFRNGEGPVLAVSDTTLALVWGSGKEVAFESLAKDVAVRSGPPKFLLRTDAVITDLAWSDTDSQLLATGQDNGTTKVWAVPRDGLTQDLVAAHSELRGVHKKKVVCVAWSPVASDVLATGAADGSLAVWVAGEAKYLLPHPAALYSVAWSPDGALLLTTAADKKTRVWDVRANAAAPASEWTSLHDGVKPATGLFVSSDAVLTAGFNKNRERQLQLWSVGQQKQLAKSSLDSGTGVMSVAFDATSGLLFVSGRGDSTVRVFEVFDDALSPIDPCGDPSLSFLSVAIMPKRAVSVNQCEIVRLYGAAGATAATNVVPIPFVAPRKVQKFDPDLYLVEAAAGVPACSAADWAAGYSGGPRLLSLDPALRAGAALSTKEANEKKAAEGKNFRRWNESESDAGAEVAPEAAAAAKIDVEAPEVKKFEAVEYKQVSVVRSSFFRHTFGQPVQAKDQVTGVTPSRGAGDGALIAASSQFIAVPYDGPGGRVAVVPTSFAGRLPDNFSMIETGSAVVDFCWSTFHGDVLVTAQDNASVMVWKLPPGGLSLAKNAANVNSEALKLTGHRRRVTGVVSNPAAENILSSVSSAAGEVKIWDLQKGGAALAGVEGQEGIFSLAWNYNGSLLASIGRDGVRIIDPRKQSVVQTFAAHDLPDKTASVCWGKGDRLVSAGFGKGSQRQVRVYDARKAEVLQTYNLDIANGALTIHFDVDTGVLFLAGKGEGSVTMLEVTPEDSKCVHELTSYRSKDPQVGVCFLPKQSCDIREVEIARMLKLHSDRIEPVKFIVPRQRKEFFQDDLFPATRSTTRWSSAATEWAAGATVEPVLESVMPAGMTALSVAPAVEKEKKPTSAYFLAKADEQKSQSNDAETIKDNLFKKVTSRFKEDETAKPAANTEVGDEEWGD